MLQDFFSLLFPRCCLISQKILTKGERYIATSCALQLPKYDLSIPNENLEKRFYGLITTKHTFAYYKFSKNSNVQKLLHQLKYGNCPELGEITAQWFAHALVQAGYKSAFDIIIPVPMHRIKQKKRGYNQCDYIAKGLSAILEIPWDSKLLEKKVNTKTQTKMSRVERFANAASVFGVRDKEAALGKRILLIDDVVTTGATLSMCAQVLLEHGCTEVSIAALSAPE